MFVTQYPDIEIMNSVFPKKCLINPNEDNRIFSLYINNCF